MTQPTCISYIRFSSERQSLGSSLERQFQLSIEYAARHGYVIDERFVYRDLGVSAFTGEHAKVGDLYRFLEAIRNGKIPKGSILLVESLDRLSRESVLDAFAQFQEILNEGIKVITLCDEMEYTKENLGTDFSKLLISLSIMMRANEEIKLRSKRIREGFEKKRKNLSNVKMSANGPSWLKLIKATNTFEVITERADIIRDIFQMSFDGHGITTIARRLNQSQVPAFRSPRGWNHSSVRKLLSSRSVIGEYQPHIQSKDMKKPIPVGDVVLNYFPAIIDEEIYYAVQARLSNGTHVAGRTAKIENIFGSMTTCGYCGARMDVTAKGKHPNIVRYLVCSNARSGIKCSYISFICNELEDAFLSYCKEIDIRDVLKLERLHDRARLSELNLQLSSKRGQLNQQENVKKILDKELINIKDADALKYLIPKLGELERDRTIIGDEITNIINEINKMTACSDDVDSRINNILELVASFKESSNEKDLIEFRVRLRNELRQIVSKVIVYPRGDVATDEQIDELNQRFETKISGSDDLHKDMYREMRDTALKQMRNSQKNTKADRYFEIHFRNNNFRRIHYSKERKTYEVSFDRTGNIFNWTMFGKQMPTIVRESESEQIHAEVEYFRKSHPEMTSEQATNMERALQEVYNQEVCEDECSPPMIQEP